MPTNFKGILIFCTEHLNSHLLYLPSIYLSNRAHRTKQSYHTKMRRCTLIQRKPTRDRSGTKASGKACRLPIGTRPRKRR